MSATRKQITLDGKGWEFNKRSGGIITLPFEIGEIKRSIARQLIAFDGSEKIGNGRVDEETL